MGCVIEENGGGVNGIVGVRRLVQYSDLSVVEYLTAQSEPLEGALERLLVALEKFVRDRLEYLFL